MILTLFKVQKCHTLLRDMVLFTKHHEFRSESSQLLLNQDCCSRFLIPFFYMLCELLVAHAGCNLNLNKSCLHRFNNPQ